jgi:hypothetical protein
LRFFIPVEVSVSELVSTQVVGASDVEVVVSLSELVSIQVVRASGFVVVSVSKKLLKE